MFIANVHRQSHCQPSSPIILAGNGSQCAPLDLKRPAPDSSVHRWTSNGQLPAPVCTAGPQTASSRLQCAPLDLKRPAPDSSVHRWTSNGQLPTPVCTAGPQTASSRLQCAPLDLKNRMPERMPNRMPDRMPTCSPHHDIYTIECINVMVGITRSRVIAVFLCAKSMMKHRDMKEQTCLYWN